VKKLTILVLFLGAAVSNLAIAKANTTEPTVSVPEIVACESAGRCEMTTIEQLNPK
jgi:hypothetical protein